MWEKAQEIRNKYCTPLWVAGHPAYLVGGCVRDLCLGIEPKDYDIATSALPEQVQTILGGKYISAAQAYPIVIVDGLEIATFRKDGSNRQDAQGIILGATMLEDAQRRDFTCNTLYYYDRIYDPTGDGLRDMNRRILNFVGDAYERIQEDPLRCLRAVRFALKLGFRLGDATREALQNTQLGYSNPLTYL